MEYHSTIFEQIGIDTSGYNMALYADKIRKIRKDHGDETREGLRGQRAVVVEDFDYILEVINNPEVIEDAGIYETQPAIKMKKDGFTVIAVISGEVFDIYPQTMYISKKNRNPTPAVDEQASTNTSETTRKTVPTNNIPRREGNVTKKYSIDVDSLGNKLTEKKNDRAKMEYHSTQMV